MTGTVILDNEAVQALSSASHPKHRRALSFVQVVAARKRKGRLAVRIVVPTAVRVEAGWDRSDPRAAFLNLLGVSDVPLDRENANRAAAITSEHHTSVADAHIGATAQLMADDGRPVSIISSDPGDMRVVVGSSPVAVIRL